MESTAAAPESLTYAEARARVLAAVVPLPPEAVPLVEARGRALRQTVTATHALPPFRNSSMDGVAVRSQDLAAAPLALPLAAVIPAGLAEPPPLAPRTASRIMTGAMLPEGADAVVPVEEIETHRGQDGVERVRFERPTTAGAHVRDAAADLAPGAVALEDGRELSALDLGLLGALGVARPQVGRRPAVAVLSTGDELLDISEPLRPGAIRDSNLPMLVALIEDAGARVVRAARLPDDPARVAAQIGKAIEVADVVVTIGGVSAGDFDPVKESLAAVGGIELWRVAMKPGRPQAFGRPQGRLFFGLPGNPASVACVFEALLRPALRRMQGYGVLDRPRFPVLVQAPIESRVGRTDFVRAVLAWRDGAWWASPAGDQVSGHLTPQSRAHGLLIVPENAARLEHGDRAEIWLLRWPETAPA